MHGLYDFVGTADYYVLGAVAFWGLYCIILIWSRVSKARFKSEALQDEFLTKVESCLNTRDFEGVKALCEGDDRSVPSMIKMVMENRDVNPDELEGWVMDRFQFDVINQINGKISWVSTIIKAAPMLGLIGTVAGMMGAFNTLEKATAEEPTKQLLADIRMALEHTLMGLLITVTLLICMASINNRIRDLEELVVFGMNRFFKSFRTAVARRGVQLRQG
jgi:biopolymer transport protein ExbB